MNTEVVGIGSRNTEDIRCGLLFLFKTRVLVLIVARLGVGMFEISVFKVKK